MPRIPRKLPTPYRSWETSEVTPATGTDLVAAKALPGTELATKALPSMPFSGIGGQSWGSGIGYGDALRNYLSGTLPGARKDWARVVGERHRNAIVAIALAWYVDNFPQALPIVTKKVSGKDKEVDGHKLTKLLRRPNPAYGAWNLWAGTLLSLLTGREAFWIKARGFGGFGEPMQLWWVPHWAMFPQWPTGPTTTWIDHYLYVVDGRAFRVDPRDVIHFRRGFNPYNIRVGFDRLDPQLRSLAATNEADTFTASILENMGIPATFFSPETLAGDDWETGDDKWVLDFTRRYQQATTGENRGRAFVAHLKMTAQQLGLSPEEMALDTILDRPIAQICAAMRIAPMVLGLPDTGRTYSNYQEARTAAWEDGVIPLQGWIAQDIEHQLLPDLGDPDERVDWDRSMVPAMREANSDMTNRASVMAASGNVSFNESREVQGLPPVAGGDTLYFVGGAWVEIEALAAAGKAKTPPIDADAGVDDLDEEEGDDAIDVDSAPVKALPSPDAIASPEAPAVDDADDLDDDDVAGVPVPDDAVLHELEDVEGDRLNLAIKAIEAFDKPLPRRGRWMALCRADHWRAVYVTRSGTIAAGLDADASEDAGGEAA